MNNDVRTTARKFVAATSREALRLVREALGAEAIVLTNRASAEGVEIVAMAEGDVSATVAQVDNPMPARAPAWAAPVIAAPVAPMAVAPSAPSAPTMAERPAAPRISFAPTPLAATPAAPRMAPAPAAPMVQAAQAARAVAAEPAAVAATADESVLNELHSMRGMLEEQLASVVWNDKQRRDPVRGRVLRTLVGAGFSARLARAMLEKMPTGQSYADGMAYARSELIRAVPVHEDEDALFRQGGVYALMGPTGVGKTTTTAKLASR